MSVTLSMKMSPKQAGEMYMQLNKAENTLRDIEKAIHYPGCWDTTAYPTLLSAITELGCNPADCALQEDSSE